MHSSGPAVVSPCCFAKLGLERLENVARSPSHPVIAATPRLLVPSPPAPISQRLLTVWLSSFLGAEIWVGWEGGRRCVQGGYGGTPKEEIGVPVPLRRLPGPLVPPAPLHGPQFLPLWAAAGHSRRGSHPSKFPLGIQSPRDRETDLSGTRNLRFGKPGSSLGFSRQKGFSRIFPRFLIIF